MLRIFGALLAGLLFGLGLLLSGLANPDKVQQFLDLTHQWDPSLAFVMIGAILIGIIPFNFVQKHKMKVYAEIKLPTRKDIDKPLVIGSLLFGVGWALVGFCPGPALVSLAAAIEMAWWFVPAMLAGMFLKRVFIKNA